MSHAHSFHPVLRAATLVPAAALLLFAAGAGEGQVTPVAKDAGERVTCRKSIPTGSMTTQERSCRTERSWNQSAFDRRQEDEFNREAALDLRPPSATQTIETGTAAWDKMVPVRSHARLPYLQLVSSVQEMLRKKQCVIPGQATNKFDIDVRYAVMLDGAGKASRVVVAETGCQVLGTLVGLSVLAQADRGDFEATGEAKPRWYAGSMNFTLK